MRAVALLAIHNEERFIGACLEHLFQQGVDVYLIDNDSTDQSVAIAERYLGHGLRGIEMFPRPGGVFSLPAILKRKEELAATLDADWFMHQDADEFRVPPGSGTTLAQFFAEAESDGYNAINFLEFTFIPTLEAPDHDHPDFLRTMRRYYPYLPKFPNQLKAWARQPGPVELAWSAGHQVRFPGLRMFPTSGFMRHYQFLSVPQVIRKYGNRRFDSAVPGKTRTGWRVKFAPEKIRLLPENDLRFYSCDDELDPTHPRTRHHLGDLMLAEPKLAPAQPVQSSGMPESPGHQEEDQRPRAHGDDTAGHDTDLAIQEVMSHRPGRDPEIDNIQARLAWAESSVSQLLQAVTELSEQMNTRAIGRKSRKKSRKKSIDTATFEVENILRRIESSRP